MAVVQVAAEAPVKVVAVRAVPGLAEAVAEAPEWAVAEDSVGAAD